jgi:hypothetical protein
MIWWLEKRRLVIDFLFQPEIAYQMLKKYHKFSSAWKAVKVNSGSLNL